MTLQKVAFNPNSVGDKVMNNLLIKAFIVFSFGLFSIAALADANPLPGDTVDYRGKKYRFISCLNKMHAQPQECRYSGCPRDRIALMLDSSTLCPSTFEPIACLCESKKVEINQGESVGEY